MQLKSAGIFTFSSLDLKFLNSLTPATHLTSAANRNISRSTRSFSYSSDCSSPISLSPTLSPSSWSLRRATGR